MCSNVVGTTAHFYGIISPGGAAVLRNIDMPSGSGATNNHDDILCRSECTTQTTASRKSKRPAHTAICSEVAPCPICDNDTIICIKEIDTYYLTTNSKTVYRQPCRSGII